MLSAPVNKLFSIIGFFTVAFAALLVAIVHGSLWVPAGPISPRGLTAPIVALAALTAIAWALMFLFRTIGVERGNASIRYFHLQGSADTPAEWVERPGRAFKNLLEVPVLFYLVCVLMLVTGDFDPIQLTLSWVYVAARLVHAAIYIAVNHLPSRMTAYLCSCVVLIVLWVRFAA